MKPTCGVEDHDVEPLGPRSVEALRGCSDRVGAIGREYRELDLLAELLELVDRRGTLEVARHEPGPLALAPEEQAELRGGGRLPRALQPGEQDHGRRTPEREARVAGSHQRRQLLVDDLHDLLARGEAPQDVLAQRPFLDRGGEVAGDLEVDVGLEQREPDLAHRLRDRVLVETAAAPETTEGRLELVAEGVEHGRKVYVPASVRPAAWKRHEGAPTLLRWTSGPCLHAATSRAARSRSSSRTSRARPDCSTSSASASPPRAPGCARSCATRRRSTTARRSTGPVTAPSSPSPARATRSQGRRDPARAACGGLARRRGAATADRYPHGRAGSRRRGLRRDGRGGRGADLRRRPRRPGGHLSARRAISRASCRRLVPLARAAPPEGRPDRHAAPAGRSRQAFTTSSRRSRRSPRRASRPSTIGWSGGSTRSSGSRLLRRRPGVRLVTITGPGGAGKSRLALELAARAALDRPVHLAGLAPVSDPQLVPARDRPGARGPRCGRGRPPRRDRGCARGYARAPRPRQLRAPRVCRRADRRAARSRPGSRRARDEPRSAAPVE